MANGAGTWLVTGGAGFLGIHLCRGLLEKADKVISYDIAAIPPEEGLSGVVEVVGDIRDGAALARALEGVDTVVHAAAALALASPEEIDAVNAEGTRRVLEASRAAGVRRLVYVSTTAVYGMPTAHPITEDCALDPMGSYGIAKAKAEQYVLEQQGLSTVIIRPKSFIGTGRLGIFQVLFDWIESGCRIYILGDGTNRFQLLSVLDLVEAIRLAGVAERPSTFAAFRSADAACDDALPTRWHVGNRGDIEIAEQREAQAAGNRRRRHHEHVRRCGFL